MLQAFPYLGQKGLTFGSQCLSASTPQAPYEIHLAGWAAQEKSRGQVQDSPVLMGTGYFQLSYFKEEY